MTVTINLWSFIISIKIGCRQMTYFRRIKQDIQYRKRKNLMKVRAETARWTIRKGSIGIIVNKEWGAPDWGQASGVYKPVAGERCRHERPQQRPAWSEPYRQQPDAPGVNPHHNADKTGCYIDPDISISAQNIFLLLISEICILIVILHLITSVTGWLHFEQRVTRLRNVIFKTPFYLPGSRDAYDLFSFSGY